MPSVSNPDNPDTVIVREDPPPRIVQTESTDKVIVREDTAPRVVESNQTRVITKTVPGGRQGPEGPEGPEGPIGPQGPQGVVDPASQSYTHVQVPVAANWTIIHNLGFHPGSVYAFDSAGSSVEGEIEHLDANSLVLHFTSAFAGGAYLS